MKRLSALTAGLALIVSMGAANAQSPNFDDPKEFAKQKDMLGATANGPEGEPWVQHYGDQMADTAKYKKDGPHTVCFSNAGVNNPWRVVGWTVMQAQVDMLGDKIEEFQSLAHVPEPSSGGLFDVGIGQWPEAGDQCE